MARRRKITFFYYLLGGFLLLLGYWLAGSWYYLPEKNAGAMTVSIYNRDAFINSYGDYQGLDKETINDISYGLSFFRLPWVKAPSSTQLRDGLGPLFDANSCRSCHILNGKGSAPPIDKYSPSSASGLGLIVKLQDRQTKKGDPFFGDQLSRHASHGIKKEPGLQYMYEKVARTSLQHSLKPGADLYRLQVVAVEEGRGTLSTNSVMSLRLAPHLIGLGLIEHIAGDDIAALADPQDKNGDGISGRLNWVYSPELKKKTWGRYGWKAGKATLADQIAAAFGGDMGITSKYFPQEDLTIHQEEALKATPGGNPEIEERQFAAVVNYVRYLKVPQRKDVSPFKMARGRHLFNRLQCSKCHISRFKTLETEKVGLTGKNSPLRGQWIYPYSDFLLHDMGDGLADQVTEGQAQGREWRTAPLWGLGLVQTVNTKARFLHDGRAASIEEAILWHGGEAQSSQQAFLHLNPKEKRVLIYFVERL